MTARRADESHHEAVHLLIAFFFSFYPTSSTYSHSNLQRDHQTQHLLMMDSVVGVDLAWLNMSTSCSLSCSVGSFLLRDHVLR